MRQTGCLSMLFNSFIFLGVFLPITYAVFWLLGTAKARYVWLTVTGYVFYGYWDPRFCLLMAFSTLGSGTIGRRAPQCPEVWLLDRCQGVGERAWGPSFEDHHR